MHEHTNKIAAPANIWQENKVCQRRSDRRMMKSRKFSWPWMLLMIMNLLSIVVIASCNPEETTLRTNFTASVKETTYPLVHRHHNHNNDRHQHRHQQQRRSDDDYEHDYDDQNQHHETKEAVNHSASSAPVPTLEMGKENFPVEYWIRVAQAKAMAISVVSKNE